MRTKLQLSEITETIYRGKNYFQVFSEIYGLQEKFKTIDDTSLLEYVPVKIVACFEHFFRVEYKEILDHSKTRGRLKEIDVFKNAKFDFDIIGALEENTISLSDYLALLAPCSSIDDIHKTLSQLLNINFLDKIEKKNNGKKIIETIKEVFKYRHIYSHEVPLDNYIDKKKAMKLISASCQFLEHADDVIRDALYSDHPSASQLLEDAKNEFAYADNVLKELIQVIRLRQNKESFHYNALSYISKWEEYREERALSDSSSNDGDSYYPLDYYKSLERTTRTLIKELSDDFRNELRR